MRFSLVSVDISEENLRSVKPFRSKLAQVLQSSISNLEKESRKEFGFCAGKECCIWRYGRTVGYDTEAVRLAFMRDMRVWSCDDILVGQILYIILETASIDETLFLFMTEQWVPLDSAWFQRRSCTS